MLFPRIMFRRLRIEEKVAVTEIDSTVNNNWNWKWLEETKKHKVALQFRKDPQEFELRVGDSIEKIDKAGSAYCNWCQEPLKYGGKGKAALVKHLTTEKHLAAVKTRLTTSTLGSVGVSVGAFYDSSPT